MHASRVRQIGWAAAIALCVAAFFALSLKVHAIKSEVKLTERQILALKQETLMLETEFETRASQRQLAQWNAVEFGFRPPRADQYVRGRRMLASLGARRDNPSAPPLRLARADGETRSAHEPPAMVSPITGRPVDVAGPAEEATGERLARAIGGLVAEASPIAATLPKRAAATAMVGEIAE